MSRPLRAGEAPSQQHPAEAGQGPPGGGGQHDVGVGAPAVEGKEVDHAQGVLIVLLAHRGAVHAENAHVAVLQGLAGHIDDGPVGDVGLHGIALDAHGELGALRRADVVDELVFLAGDGGGIARGGGRSEEGDLPRRARRLQRDDPGGAIFHRVQQSGHRLLAFGGQGPVAPDEAQFPRGKAFGPGGEAVLEQEVRLRLQRGEEFEQNFFPGHAHARFVIAHGRLADAQPRCQLRLGQALCLSLLAQPLPKTHGHRSFPFLFLLYRGSTAKSIASTSFLKIPVDKTRTLVLL